MYSKADLTVKHKADIKRIKNHIALMENAIKFRVAPKAMLEEMTINIKHAENSIANFLNNQHDLPEFNEELTAIPKKQAHRALFPDNQTSSDLDSSLDTEAGDFTDYSLSDSSSSDDSSGEGRSGYGDSSHDGYNDDQTREARLFKMAYDPDDNGEAHDDW